ncbi:Tesmin/TSO1-like CXC domain-containing protein, putative isoform 1 [Hibiscus syriacus]|uniref:Tesmin/TSO1-like CXC domain-containing protein, putative isoform 1 n=1 Tax=Hibiscus syriacus TaxID=106335 RepID=A0A6A3AGG4_HIBSY|nr:Tesmin/TSO1-like CXC domain-containing protein, putative isoform 1 [Hibiscus syriacus]
MGMGLKLGEEDGGVIISDENPKLKASGINAKDMIFRADKIDLKTLDMQLEKHLNSVWTKNVDEHKPADEWEIDLAKLELRYVVARGTYGTVYRATYDNNDVAVKVLDWSGGGASETAAMRASFKQEVAVWHKLNHHNVTKFVGASMGTSNLKIPLKYPSADGRNSLPSRACCVVVEYLPGGTLKQYLIRNRRKKLALKVVVQLALDLSRGLSYLHSKKIVHRDVKTENLLLDAHKNVKIADFGVARVEAWNPCEMTGETGTLGYMAPEVLSGKPYNRKCDVYSFGICLWKFIAATCLIRISASSRYHPQLFERTYDRDPTVLPEFISEHHAKMLGRKPKEPSRDGGGSDDAGSSYTSKGGGMIPEDRSPGCFCLAVRGP